MEGEMAQSQMPEQNGDNQQAVKKVRTQMTISTLGKVLAAIVVLAVVVGIISFLNGNQGTSPGTSTVVTTIAAGAMQITGCTNVTQPGSYYLSGNINVSISSGKCINVMSDNVHLIGNQNRITGTGPFVGVAPYTYGIYVGQYINVTVDGFALSSFSYGIYLNRTTGSRLELNNVTKMAMSGIFLNTSTNNIVLNNTITGISGLGGGINLFRGGNNRVIGEVIINNAHYGLVSNSTNNTYQRNVFTKNPVDVFCPFLNTSFRHSNLFGGQSSCATNSYCNFAQCSSSNLPSQVSSFTLSAPTISSCGGINAGGVYTLSGDLNMESYLNVSNPLSNTQACITILAPDVTLNCNYHRIINAPYGVDASGQFNTTIRNCIFENESVAGISADSNFNLNIMNVSVNGSVFGIKLTNGTIATVTNTIASHNTYGFYVNATGALSIGKFNANNNTYGTFIDSATGVSLSSGNLFSNSKTDVFCSANTYNSTQNQFQNVNCGSTDCAWATSCPIKQKPPIGLFPINTCFTITQAGNYSLSGNIIGTDKCLNIQASDVNVNCNGYDITGSLQGSAIFVRSNVKNVVISSCKVHRYQYGILAANASGLTIQNSVMGTVMTGILLRNVSTAIVQNNYVSGASGSSGYVFTNVTNSTIYANTAFGSAGINSTEGFTLTNSTRDIVSFNNATHNTGWGLSFVNSSGNSVFNNSAFTNGQADWACTNSSSGIYAQSQGVNFGVNKTGCRWLVLVNPLAVLAQTCLAINQGTNVNFDTDYVYGFGGTCFSVYNSPGQNGNRGSSGNETTINCYHHTILASNGGIFLNVINSTDVVLENCYLKGFTNAVRTSGYRTIIENNTIASTANTSIAVLNNAYPIIRNNKVLNATNGYFFSNSIQGMILNNIAINADNGFTFVKGTGHTVTNNSATNGGIGALLLNSTIDLFQNNFFSGIASGISCVKFSQNSTSLNRDMGNNACSSNSACSWMSVSQKCLVA
ncbi:MAG: right-handed parallel beta-helix repeat-containing protein [Candidatus Micrarchaeota archaeon]|nr:right-handed parallel beta-helix repeat-containing protein [Candidatus Micrarchaeota archaeon]